MIIKVLVLGIFVFGKKINKKLTLLVMLFKKNLLLLLLFIVAIIHDQRMGM